MIITLGLFFLVGMAAGGMIMHIRHLDQEEYIKMLEEDGK